VSYKGSRQSEEWNR